MSNVEPEFTPSPPQRLVEGHSDGRIKIQLYLWRPPTESIRMTSQRAGLVLYGPWEVTWDVPKSGGGMPPRVLSIENAAESVHGIKLQVEKVIASDRLTAVDVLEVRQPASDPWDVDIWLKFGEHRLHFARARLVRPSAGNERLILNGEWASGAREDRRPVRLHVASLTRPGGQQVSAGQDGLGAEEGLSANAQVYQEQPSGTWEVELSLPVTNRRIFEVISTRAISAIQRSWK